MARAIAAIKSARKYLNDIAGTQWSDSVLMPFLQEAHGEMMQELDLNQLGVLKYETTPILIPAGQKDMGDLQPSNILDPISMYEAVPGHICNQEMFLVDYLPEQDPGMDLYYWAWRRERILFLGATRDRAVILRYKGFICPPNLLTDPIGVIFGERYLGPRIAALAYDSLGKDSSKFDAVAQAALYKLIQRGVLEDQRPISRRAYRSPKGLPFGFAFPIKITVGGPVVSSDNTPTMFKQSLLLNVLTPGNTIAHEVPMYGANNGEAYDVIGLEYVVKYPITQNCVFNFSFYPPGDNVNKTLISQVTARATDPMHTTLLAAVTGAVIVPDKSVLVADIISSDGGTNANGIITCTLLYRVRITNESLVTQCPE